MDKENIENAAAVTGGILGLVLSGPVGGLILAALTNYVVKKENDSGEALRCDITFYLFMYLMSLLHFFFSIYILHTGVLGRL